MPAFPIKLDLEVELGLDTVVGEVPGSYDEDNNYEPEPITLADLVSDKIADKIVSEGKRSITEQIGWRNIHEKIDERLSAALDESIAKAITRAIQPTNHFGEPKGEPVTMSEYLADRVEKWLKTGNDRYTSNQSNLNKILGETFDRTLRAEMEKAVQAVRNEALKKVTAEMSAIVSDAIVKLVDKNK